MTDNQINSEKRKVKFTLIFSLLFVVLLFIFLLLLLVVLNFAILPRRSTDIYSPKTYQLYEFNSERNTSTFELIRLDMSLRKEEFIVITSKSSLYLISGLTSSSSLFECYGTCECSENEDIISTTKNTELTRRQIGVVSKSLYFVLSAVSTILAISIGHKYISDECISQFSSICKPENIISEFNSCSPKLLSESSPAKSHDEYDYKDEIFDLVDETEEVDDLFVIFDCEGYCVPHVFSPEEFPRTDIAKEVFQARDDFRCEEHSITGKLKMPSPVVFDSIEEEMAEEINAKKLFNQRNLHPFCKSISIYGRDKGVINGSGTVTLCVGIYHFDSPDFDYIGEANYHNVKCIKRKL